MHIIQTFYWWTSKNVKNSGKKVYLNTVLIKSCSPEHQLRHHMILIHLYIPLGRARMTWQLCHPTANVATNTCCVVWFKKNFYIFKVGKMNNLGTACLDFFFHHLYAKNNKRTEEIRIRQWKGFYKEHRGSGTPKPANKFKMAELRMKFQETQ